MAEVNRICPACGKNSPMEAQYCPHCGADTHTGVPMRQTSLLPATVSKVAMPLLATAATLAMRMIWRLVRERMILSPMTPAQSNLQTNAQKQPVQKAAEADIQAKVKSGRSIRIRTAWAVGDATGVQRQGYTDQQIDFDD